MLRTVADLLGGFLDEEKEKLDNFKLKHAPTIGKMYEGLTSDIIERVIPEQIGLKIVTGVIYDDTGEMTGEIDCMLVEGEGIEIPHTESYKWHVKHVICVFEVKKTLYSKDLSDSFIHLKGVLDSYSRYIESGNADYKVDLSPIRKAFSMMARMIPPKHEEASTMPLMEEMLYHTLVMEHLSPIRIVLGYHGFKSEFTFRESMCNLLEANVNKQGFGVGSFPQLIICDKYSLVKGNGQPYSPPLRNGYWDFMFSSAENPLIFILELIWTRLQYKYNLGGLWGEDLEEEGFHMFLSGKIVEKDGKIGWDYQYTPIDKKELEEEYEIKKWEPARLNQNQFVIINRLCIDGSVNITEPDFTEWLEQQSINTEEFIKSLLDTNLTAVNGDVLKLTTEKCECVISPTDGYLAADNNTGRLTRWIEENMKRNKLPNKSSNLTSAKDAPAS